MKDILSGLDSAVVRLGAGFLSLGEWAVRNIPQGRGWETADCIMMLSSRAPCAAPRGVGLVPKGLLNIAV